MSDEMVRVDLPRAFVEELWREKHINAKALRRRATLTESHAPSTKRNAKVVAAWRAEADGSDLIATQCGLALHEQRLETTDAEERHD